MIIDEVSMISCQLLPSTAGTETGQRLLIDLDGRLLQRMEATLNLMSDTQVQLITLQMGEAR